MGHRTKGNYLFSDAPFFAIVNFPASRSYGMKKVVTKKVFSVIIIIKLLHNFIKRPALRAQQKIT